MYSLRSCVSDGKESLEEIKKVCIPSQKIQPNNVVFIYIAAKFCLMPHSETGQVLNI